MASIARRQDRIEETSAHPKQATAGRASSCESVTKRFGDVVAVAELSLALEQGEFFTLLGPSGCGKTTTLRMVAGFEEPTDGRAS